MRLKKVTCGAALIGLAAGFVGISADSAHAAFSTTVAPFVGTQGTPPSIGVGSTTPGVADGEACLIGKDTVNTGNNGKINGVVVGGHAGELNVTYTGLDSGDPVSTCVQVEIGISGDATFVSSATKTGGALTVTTTTELQGGISALAHNTLNVTLAAGQTMKTPLGATLTGPGTFQFDTKDAAVKTKAVYNTSCSDHINVVDPSVNDSTSKGNPTATEWVNGDAVTGEQYIATMRSCALDPTAIPGKPVALKLTVVGDGATTVRFVRSNTVGPKTWDTTRGSCGVVKVASDKFGTDISDASRIIACKGDYGDPLPVSIGVWAWGTNGGQDPNGLDHHVMQTTIASGVFA